MFRRVLVGDNERVIVIRKKFLLSGGISGTTSEKINAISANTTAKTSLKILFTRIIVSSYTTTISLADVDTF